MLLPHLLGTQSTFCYHLSDGLGSDARLVGKLRDRQQPLSLLKADLETTNCYRRFPINQRHHLVGLIPEVQCYATHDEINITMQLRPGNCFFMSI